MDNTIISQWRGDNPDTRCTLNIGDECPGNIMDEENCPVDCEMIKPDYTSYTTDPSAWDEKLYGEIEEKGLIVPFLFSLNGMQKVPKDISTIGWQWLSLKAAPEQKASALSRAIKESE